MVINWPQFLTSIISKTYRLIFQNCRLLTKSFRRVFCFILELWPFKVEKCSPKMAKSWFIWTFLAIFGENLLILIPLKQSKTPSWILCVIFLHVYKIIHKKCFKYETIGFWDIWGQKLWGQLPTFKFFTFLLMMKKYFFLWFLRDQNSFNYVGRLKKTKKSQWFKVLRLEQKRPWGQNLWSP